MEYVVDFAPPEKRQFGLFIAASYLHPIDGQVHPLQLVLEGRPELHQALANGGIFIDGSAALDTSVLDDLYRIATGTVSGYESSNTVNVSGQPHNSPYIIGETAEEEAARLEAAAQQMFVPSSPLQQIPLTFNSCLEGGFADVLRDADTIVRNWNHVDVSITVSPSARDIGITSLQNRFAKHPNIKFYLAGPMPEDNPLADKLFTGMSERKYTRLLAGIAVKYGLRGLSSFGANAEDTMPFQELIAMGVVMDNIKSYQSVYEYNGGTEVEVARKRAVVIEKALRGATFDARGVCNTKLLVGHELARANGHREMLKLRKERGDSSFDWASADGLELAENYAKILQAIIDRAHQADLSPVRKTTVSTREKNGIPVVAPMLVERVA